VRQSVIHFALRIVQPAPQDIQLAPQIFLPNIPDGGSNAVSANSNSSDDEFCIAVKDEYENRGLGDTISG